MNKINLMRICYILIVVALCFQSCTKDDASIESIDSTINAQQDSNGVEPLFNPQISPNQDLITKKIKEFSSRIVAVRNDEPGSRNGGLAIEDATWNVEALLNASYANAASSINEISRSEYSFSIPHTNGEINNENLLLAFESSRSALETQYENVNSDDKQIVYADLEMEDMSQTFVNFKLSTLISINPDSYTPPDGDCEVFDPILDWWYAVTEQGMCCEPYGGLGKDAADILETEINNRHAYPADHLYFVDEEVVEIYPYYGISHPDDPPNSAAYYLENPDFDLSSSSCRNHLVWHAQGSDVNGGCGCVSPTDLDWYYCNMCDLIPQFAPAGKTFIAITMFDNQGSGNHHFHHAVVTYGISISCLDDCPPCPPNDPDCEPCC